MRRKVFLFLSSLAVMALVAVIPADLAVARLSSSEPPPVTAPAQSAEEKALVDEILRELVEAKGMTSDSGVLGEIGAIVDMVRKIDWLEFTNQAEDALSLKYAIAERLETLINELPLASPGTATTLAALPAANPLYEELVRVRAKIDKLIAMETLPEAVPPPPPTLSRTPETERLIIYSAKFLCGPAFGGEGVQRGSYSTAINVHNPHDGTVYLYKKAVIANREDDPRGRISPFRKVVLGADEAIEIDCLDIHSLLGPEEEETGLARETEGGEILTSPGLSAVSPVSSLVRFIKGFVVIYASAPLDVVGVYTASTSAGFSLDVEYIPTSRVSSLPVTPPECPQGCQCLTKLEAEEAGLTSPCGGEVRLCGYDENGNERYCFTKPGEVVCPDGCACLVPEEAKRLGLEPCDGKEIRCGTDTAGNILYCYEKSTEECPDGCVCLNEENAVARGYTEPCLDATGSKIICGRDAQQNLLYCWKMTEEVECPQGCVCLSELEAARGGYTFCGGKQIPCGYAPGAPQKWCYETGVPARLAIDPSQASNLVGTEHTVTIIVYDQYGKPLANARVTISVSGVHSFAPIELTTGSDGKASFDYTGTKTGNDVIVATISGLQATAYKTWYSRGAQ